MNTLVFKKILFVLMPVGYQEVEFGVPHQLFTQKKYHIDVAGLRPGVAKGHRNASLTPNLQLGDLTSTDFDKYDALVIPGGPGSTTYLWNNKMVQAAARLFHEKHKLVATICYACIVPAQAGLLKGKKATVYPTDEAKEILQTYGVTFVDEGCVTLEHERIITAQGPTYAQEFAQAIVKILEAPSLTTKKMPAQPHV